MPWAVPGHCPYHRRLISHAAPPMVARTLRRNAPLCNRLLLGDSGIGEWLWKTTSAFISSHSFTGVWKIFRYCSICLGLQMFYSRQLKVSSASNNWKIL